MYSRVRQLDALLLVMANATDGDEGFLNLNNEIQRTAIELASDLATEIHELQEELLCARMNELAEKEAQARH